MPVGGDKQPVFISESFESLTQPVYSKTLIHWGTEETTDCIQNHMLTDTVGHMTMRMTNLVYTDYIHTTQIHNVLNVESIIQSIILIQKKYLLKYHCVYEVVTESFIWFIKNADSFSNESAVIESFSYMLFKKLIFVDWFSESFTQLIH